MISYCLCYPPSSNKAYANSSEKGRIATKRLWLWRENAGKEIQAQGKKRLSGPVVVAVEARAPDRRARDLDNLLKPILDLLVSMQIIEDDKSKIVRSITAHWSDGDPGVTVTVWSTDAIRRPSFLAGDAA